MSICTCTYAVYYNNDYMFVNDFVFLLLFYSHRKCTNLIRDVPLKSTQSNKRGFSGEGEEEGGRGREREGGKESKEKE